MTTRAEVVPPSSLATKGRALTVIENAALRRREALLARLKPLNDELKQLDAILATVQAEPTPPAADEPPTLFPE